MKTKKFVRIIKEVVLYISALTFTCCAPMADMRGETLSNRSGIPELEKIGETPRGDLRYKIQFVDSMQAWLSNGTKLWQTSNGGLDWEPVQSREAKEQGIINFQFLDSKVGWVLRYSGLYRTEDGGDTWMKLTLPVDFPKGEIRDIKFLNNGKVGWLVGGIYQAVSRKELMKGFPNNVISPKFDAILYGAIFRTSDGGITWYQQLISSSVYRFLEVCFLSAQSGIALGDLEIFYTDDGGQKWMQAKFKKGCVDQTFLREYEAKPVSASLIDSGLGWLSYNDGRIVKSTDKGQSWCDLVRPGDIWPTDTLSAFFRRIHFIDESNGWALQGEGSLYKTKNGGLAWHRIPIDIKFDDLYFLDAQHGWAVAEEGLFRINLQKK